MNQDYVKIYRKAVENKDNNVVQGLLASPFTEKMRKILALNETVKDQPHLASLYDRNVVDIVGTLL